MKQRLVTPLFLALAAALLATGCSTVRVSLSSAGVEGNDHSQFPRLSASGQFVVFESFATNLVGDDYNLTVDVFVRNMLSGETRQVSLNSSGVEGNRASEAPVISANGRYVAFGSYAYNLVPGDTNEVRDIFLRDLQTGVTTRVSVSTSGQQADRSSHDLAAISADGRYVAFISHATNLVTGTASYLDDVYVRDTVANVTTRVSVSSSGAEGNSHSSEPAISADGRYVAFSSEATNLTDDEISPYSANIYLHDRQTGKTTLVSRSAAGGPADSSSRLPSLSPDGRYIAFVSYSTNLLNVPDTNGKADIYLHDLKTGMTRRVSLASNGGETNGDSYNPSVSSDGMFVAFASDATNLVEGDSNGKRDVFVRNMLTGETKQVSLADPSIKPNGHSDYPAISPSGEYIVFQSTASNLVNNDQNGKTDVFMRDMFEKKAYVPAVMR